MDDSIVSRFEKYIDKSADCWLWTRGCDKDGYGIFTLKHADTWKAHRFSYYLANGELPKSPLVVRHKCKSKNCVNPDHLESGTKSENQLDKVRDGTDIRGIKHHNAKLTKAQVLEIRGRSTENQRDLAKEFNVSSKHINNIIFKRTWTWLE